MSAPVYNIAIDQGGTFKLTLKVTDSLNNNILSSAVSAAAQIRQNITSNTQLADFNCAFTSNNASLVLTLTANQTTTFTTNNMVWDCKVTFADGTQTYLAGGKVMLRLSVTR